MQGSLSVPFTDESQCLGYSPTVSTFFNYSSWCKLLREKKKCRYTLQESVQVIAAWNLRKKRLLVSEHKDVIAVASESLAYMFARICGVCAPMFVSMYGFSHACFQVHMPVVMCAYSSGHAWAHTRLWHASLWACMVACVHVCGHMCALV